jgi:hypothetical protein
MAANACERDWRQVRQHRPVALPLDHVCIPPFSAMLSCHVAPARLLCPHLLKRI